ncbi:MAG TPA: hypothetical protein DCE18_01705 [Syntrophobacteraceae bacterium]|jgi:N-acetylmuramoyl-L-alanine amidase|nr:hypothetical protein [Syntrophobacteraceae bacterium]
MNRYRDHLGRPSETELLARFIWNEAREERLQGKLAVAHVVMNRVKTREYYGNSIQDVILKSKDLMRLSGSNTITPHAPNCPSNDREFALCQAIAELATRGHLKDDPTGGATHFHRVNQKPAWASKLIFQRQIGSHVFYRDPLMRCIQDHSLKPQTLTMGREP